VDTDQELVEAIRLGATLGVRLDPPLDTPSPSSSYQSYQPSSYTPYNNGGDAYAYGLPAQMPPLVPPQPEHATPTAAVPSVPPPSVPPVGPSYMDQFNTTNNDGEDSGDDVDDSNVSRGQAEKKEGQSSPASSPGHSMNSMNGIEGHPNDDNTANKSGSGDMVSQPDATTSDIFGGAGRSNSLQPGLDVAMVPGILASCFSLLLF
jgi:hypothetical protein